MLKEGKLDPEDLQPLPRDALLRNSEEQPKSKKQSKKKVDGKGKKGKKGK